MYLGLKLLFPDQCPRCNKIGYVTKQRWNGVQEDHCTKCGASFNKFGTPKHVEPDEQHIRTEQAAIILDHCQNTPKIGTSITRKHNIPTELLTDLATAGLLHNAAPDLYLTSSRGKRFLQTRQSLVNIGKMEAHQ